MNIPVYVINLDRSAERWASVSEATAGLPIDLRRIAALDGRTVDPADWQDVDEATFRKHTGRGVLPGEYGCYRSHMAALSQFLSDGAPYGVIMEDDVVPNERTGARLDAIVEALRDFDAVKLANHRTRFFIAAARTSAGDVLGRTLHGPQGSAAAYLVSRRGAERLVEALRVQSLPFDVALERFWANGTKVYTVAEHVFDFTQHRDESNIATSYGYDGSSIRDYLSTAMFRLREHGARFHGAFLPPDRGDFTHAPAPDLPTSPHRMGGRVLQWSAALLVLAFLSALWIETDVYRGAGLALLLVATVHYARSDLWDYWRPRVGWAGLACFAWVTYLFGRFAITSVLHPELGTGTNEGIYAFPLLYPTFGYALYLLVPRAFPLIVAFMAASLAAIAADLDLASLQEGVRPWTRMHNNSIHAAIACGFVLVLSIPFIGETLRSKTLSPAARGLLVLLGLTVLVVAAAWIVALESKGVWLALAVALPVMALSILFTERSRTARFAMLAGLAGIVVGTFLAWDHIVAAAGHAIEVAGLMIGDVAGGKTPLSVLDQLVQDVRSGTSEHERLKLWANALTVWSHAPLFGNGVAWLSLWGNRPYPEPPMDIMHNGYLEVAVRYGLVGLAFYFWLYGWVTWRVRQAARAGLISPAAYQAHLGCLVFFAATILTNSNVRLAIGETYMWFAGGFGFYCYYLLQRARLVAPKTYV